MSQTWDVKMLKSVHLVGENETEDLYAGFEEEYNPAYDTEGLYEDEGFQQALKTSYGKRGPGTSAGRPPGTGFQRMGTAAGRGRPMTGVAADTSQARPMTAVRAAGYSSMGGRAQNQTFDPLNQSRGPAPPLEGKDENSPEQKVSLLEKQVMELIEESCFAAERSDLQMALEKAKEAGRKERNLCRQRDQSQMADQMNLDITYSVLFSLALSYHRLQLWHEANNTYNVIVKNKMFSNAGRLRVNIGNIFFEQGKFSNAVKFYRMALDQIPNTHKDVRIRIMKNIGIVFVRMGQYNDAITAYEHIMSDKPDVESGFNLLLCSFAIGDKENMKKAFQKLVQVRVDYEDEEKYTASPDDLKSQLILEAIRDDPLRKWEKEQKAKSERCIMMAAKLIAPVIEASFDEGFDWCVDIVKGSAYQELANELEITRSIAYLKMKDFTKATETLKKFEKKDSKMQSQAAVNLAFMYFLEGENAQSDKHADIAITADRYNPAALVNKGNAIMMSGDYNKAKEYYLEAMNIEASCTEALYNLGLCYKRMGKNDEALECFHKLHVMLPSSSEVLCQLGVIYELMGNVTLALEWYQQFLTLVPSDPTVLMRIGNLYEEEGDKSQAFQYMYESYRYYPSNIEVIAWLGSYYIDAQFIEKAITYFERAVQVQPQEVKWHLMLATCYRKAGNYGRAMQTYKEIHQKFPDNLDCLKFLVRLFNDQGLVNEGKEYANKLNKLEKNLVQKEQRAISAQRKGSGRTRVGSGQPERRAEVTRRESDLSLTSPLSSDRTPLSSDRQESGRNRKTIDASYADPIGEAPSRPKTAGGHGRPQVEDEFADEEIGDDLLPD